MQPFKVIITGATGMVGEGVLFECLQNPNIAEVLIVNRRHYNLQHPKLKELIVSDFFQMDEHIDVLKEYDACFFCAGISSVGMKEDKYTYITYNTTLAFAHSLLKANAAMALTYVSGSHTDSSEKGRIMWARVKGRTENQLIQLPFSNVYCFRPGGMLPFDKQQNWKSVYRVIVKMIRLFAPGKVVTMHELGLAMIRTVTQGYQKKILEISDIKALAK